MALVVKNLTANARDEFLIPGLGRCPGGGHGNPLQYSSLENPMDRGAWQATVHRAQTHMGKCGQEGLFCLPYINPNVKEMNIITLVQMIFNA